MNETIYPVWGDINDDRLVDAADMLLASHADLDCKHRESFVTRPRDRQTTMAGKLKEPMVITDYRREPVCILPVGFYFDDDRWEKLWQRFEEKGAPLTREDLLTLFPEEPALKHDRVDPDRG